MRIMYANFHHAWGGQAYQVYLLARSMREAGHEILVCAPPESILQQRCATIGIATESVSFSRGFRPIRLAGDMGALRRACARFKPEIIHCHGSQDSWTMAAAMTVCPEVRNAARLRTKHNSYPPQNHCINRWLFSRFFGAVIVVADSLRADLLRGGLVPEDRLHTIPAAFEPRPSDAPALKPRAAVRAEFGISENAPLVILVGRLAADKGQEVLFRAMPTLLERVPGIRALLVGKGGYNERLQALKAELALGDSVVMAGFRTDVCDLTAAADCAVLAATACDASSTVLKEAMALGVPVVGTDVGGTAGILDHGQCGLIIPPADPQALAEAIARTLQDPASSKARAQHALTYVQRYSATHVAHATEQLYSSLRTRVS